MGELFANDLRRFLRDENYNVILSAAKDLGRVA
jgi:hypothetical protein